MSTWVEGRLHRVVWASSQNGYAVVQIEVDDVPITAVGELGLLAEAELGSFVALEGDYEKHSVHGEQFRATGFLQGNPRTEKGIELYLASAGIPGVGARLASRIVGAFGMKTLDILANDPSQLKQVEGIGAKRVDVIAERWRADEEGRSVVITLRGLGLSPRLVERVRRTYRDRTAAVVTREPYRLAEEISGIGFRTADQLARHQGLPDDHPDRVRAALVHCLDQATNDGHCYLTLEALRGSVERLGVPTHGLEDALQHAESDGRVVRENAEGEVLVWLGSLYDSEVFVAQELSSRGSAQASLDFDGDSRILAAEQAEGIELDPSQREAVRTAMNGGVVVVTGGPGTGKTTLLKVLLRAVGADDWLLASPTGRAAKRLQEATGRPASTLHRLLEFNPGEGGFQRNVSHPLEGSGLIIDEASMIDLPLLRAVLEALPYPGDDFSLVLVGDADQLPSVGPGQVLRDLIDAHSLPVVRLQSVHRQAEGSDIVLAAHHIGRGELPPFTGPNRDGFFLTRESTGDVLQTLLKVVQERLPANHFLPEDIQVLTPTRKGPLGTVEVNRLLQRTLNRAGAVVREGERELREGDRVICTKNRYDLEVFNGDLGTVVGSANEGVRIRFEDRLLVWPFEDLSSVELAYAITVHKSQGSEYPAVVLLLHPSHGLMLRRNLFYTAVTRARSFLVALGTPRGWTRAVRTEESTVRNTRLAHRMGGG